MNAVKALPAIFKLAKTLHDISKQVKANKHQCHRKSFRNKHLLKIYRKCISLLKENKWHVKIFR